MLTHRSWAGERRPSNERLELLGDSVLQLMVTEALLERHPTADEGDLAWMRQVVVSRAACAGVARAAGLPEILRASAPGDRADVPAVVASERVQAGVAEALLGAAWLDLGTDAAREAVRDAFGEILDGTTRGMRDPKTELQEAAARRRLTVRYVLLSQEGPAHARAFASEAVVGDRVMGRGSGPSKRASERAAAAAALDALLRGEG